MRYTLYLLIFSWVNFGTILLADTSTKWRGTGNITFSGTSTLHDWSGEVTTDPFIATIKTADGSQLNSLTSTVEVKVASMDTAESDRDANMRKAMKATEYPIVSAEFSTTFTGDKAPAKLPFKFTILDKVQQKEGVVSNWQRSGDKVTFDVDFDVSLKASGINVPSVLLIIRVGDTIKVHTSITLTKGKP